MNEPGKAAEMDEPGKQPERVFWGGYSGTFADSDGHLWEVAYNPVTPIDADGRLVVPPPKPA